MRTLRKTIELKEGVRVALLFTPHLFSFKGYKGVNFDVDTKDTRELMECYADMFYCAYLNAWVLDGNGSEDDAPLTRGDFHEFMMLQPREFGKTINFAVECLTGKKVTEAAKDIQPEGGKKKAFRLIGRKSRAS